VHRLVCAAHCGPPPTPAHSQVHHLDGNPSDNRPENLAWATPSDNTRASHKNNPSRGLPAGAMSKPVRGRKADTDDAWTDFASNSAAARELGLNGGNIWAVLNGNRKQT